MTTTSVSTSQRKREERQVRIACAIDVLYCDYAIAPLASGDPKVMSKAGRAVRLALLIFARSSNTAKSFDEAVAAIGKLPDGWREELVRALSASHKRFLLATTPCAASEE